MKYALSVLVLCLMIPVQVASQGPGLQDELLDRMTGDWVMTGDIAGEEVTHDLSFEWVLDHQYLRFHEIAREMTPEEKPAYEAIVFIGWDQPSGRYACLWLDSTGGGGLSPQAIGYALPDDDVLAFVFDGGEAGSFHTTFIYDREEDTWRWTMDIVNGEESQAFARVKLARR